LVAPTLHTVVFDVNETMLDLAALDPHFARVFGDSGLRREWFALVLRNALTLTVIEDYSDFGTVAKTSLSMVAAARGTTISDEDNAAILLQMRNLPPHPDVIESLAMLQRSGLRLVALTNSPPDIATQQLANAGLAGYFDNTLSVHSSRRFKPHPTVYRDAATTLGVPLREMMMVAAHDWDIAGAMAVGMSGAYVVRTGMAINPLFEQPTIVANTMNEVATEIIGLG